MAISSKIKALLNLTGKDHAGLALCLGISNQALSNKFYRNSFSADDLIKVSEYINCPLAFIANGETKVILDKDDLKTK